jgi:hypothetical protein
MKRSAWTRGGRRAAFAAVVLFSAQCGQSQGTDGGNGAAQNGTSGTGGGESTAGLGGAIAAAGVGGGGGIAAAGGAAADGNGGAAAPQAGASGVDMAGSSGDGAGGSADGGEAAHVGGASAGEGGGDGTNDDSCPAMRPPTYIACLQEQWSLTCTYGSEVCDCFTPDFMHQPPLWRCTTTGAGGSS